jgi:hypothetical protein
MRAVLVNSRRERRLEAARVYAKIRGYRIVALAGRLIGALQMVDAGEADVVVVASHADLPPYLEIVSREIRVGPTRPERLR